MAKFAVNLSDDLNDSPPAEMLSAEDVMSVDSDDAADDVQIVGPAHIDFNGVDDTCNDRPFAQADEIFTIKMA